jgi:hypothetical protein
MLSITTTPEGGEGRSLVSKLPHSTQLTVHSVCCTLLDRSYGTCTPSAKQIECGARQMSPEPGCVMLQPMPDCCCCGCCLPDVQAVPGGPCWQRAREQDAQRGAGAEGSGTHQQEPGAAGAGACMALGMRSVHGPGHAALASA